MKEYELVIEPTRTFAMVRFKELWEYRELFYFLIWRDIKIRYKQTVLGVGWAVVRPVTSMLVFTFIFNRLAGFATGGVPYPLFTFAGVLAWNFFSEGLSGSSQSLNTNANLLTKVYFPRLVIPSAAVLKGLVDFAVACVILVAMMAYYRFVPGPSLALFPFVVLWLVITALGVGLWFTALGVKYRDVAQALPFVVQVLFWITPVGYSSDKIPAHLQYLYWLNPMTGVVEAFRYSLLGAGYLPRPLTWMSLALTAIVFVAGLLNFRRMEKEFADVI